MRKISLALMCQHQIRPGAATRVLLAATLGQALLGTAHAQAPRTPAAPVPTAPSSGAPAPAATGGSSGGAPAAPAPSPSAAAAPAAAGTGGSPAANAADTAAANGDASAASGGASATVVDEVPPKAEGSPAAVAPEKNAKRKKRAKPEAEGDAQAEAASGPGVGTYPSPEEDAAALESQGEEAQTVDADRVFSDDWWSHTRPALELHGNFRVRADLFDQFSLGRIDPPGTAMWPRPLDDSYQDTSGAQHEATACTPGETGTGANAAENDANQACTNSTQAGANLRFRIEPSIIISNNLRIHSQIDLFDNLVLGSTAQGYSNYPSEDGYAVAKRSGYYPVSGASWTQDPPVSGINSLSDSVAVKRAWAEYETPFGQARFGRMPDHFGLGIMHNAGDDLDGDAQSTVDRIAFATALPSLGLHAIGAWDFPYEGATSQAFIQPGQPAYDRAQYDDVSAMSLILFRRVDRQLERRILAQDGLVVNGGVYLTYAFQRIANDVPGSCESGANAIDCTAVEGGAGYSRRGMEVWTPDFYAEAKFKRFRAGLEVVTNQGRFQSQGGTNDGLWVQQWGFAGELTQRLIDDKLKIGFYFGYASGDGDVEGLVPPTGGQPQIGDSTLSTFRFHPGYRVDMILNRHILSRVQGSYYMKPQVQYDFFRDGAGMRLGGRAEAIWTRASNFMQSPGHQADLGIELNGTVYYQASDGSLNDEPDQLGGFFAMMQYGVLFPLGGLGYLSQDATTSDLKTAQNVRLFLGVAY